MGLSSQYDESPMIPLRRPALVLITAFIIAGCSANPGDESTAQNESNYSQNSNDETDDNASDDDACQLGYEIPDGQPFALTAEEIVEPDAVVALAGSFLGDLPPVLLFADELTDGADDELHLVGGGSERTGYGYDEIPDTPADTYSLYYESINDETCQFRARLQGSSRHLELEASADFLEIDLTGMSSLTDGVILQVSDAEITGHFDEPLDTLDDVVLRGVITDDGFDALLESVQDQVPVSEEQARDIIDPDGEGEVPVEMTMSGRAVTADGFIDPGDTTQIAPRADAGDCCPDGLQIGDSVIPHLNWQQQGIDSRQFELFQMALPEIRQDPHVAMAATARRQDDGTVQYEIYSGGAVDEGTLIYERHAGDDGDEPRFETIEQQGANPLANTDPKALSSYDGFVDAAINPFGTDYSHRSYGDGDERLGFVPGDQMHYPYARERIAQAFDDPRTGDLIIIPASWSTGGFGTHGNLNALQSRTPLVIAGPGIRNANDADIPDNAAVQSVGDSGQTLMVDAVARQTDIAPTIAAALGVDKTTGVGPDLRLRDDTYLRWQDGRVLDDIFTDDALDSIADGKAVAERAIVIVNDGLTNPELLHQVFSENPDSDVDVYRQLFDGALTYEHGAISNFPSNTFPGHNTIGSGAWSGHHGLIDNVFWSRTQSAEASAISEVFETEYLFGSAHPGLPVETLHEALHRSMGDDVFTASINHPSTRGAALATYERRRPDGFDIAEEADEVDVADETYPLPQVDVDDHTEVMDNSTVQYFTALFQDHITRPDDGLPIPTFTILNMASTDTAGHRYGPHGDATRDDAISHTNQRMRALLDTLEALDIDDSTLLIFTADHGMELQDQERSSRRNRPLQNADIAVRSHRWSHYFKELSAEVLDTSLQGDALTLSLRVVDRATTQGDDNAVGVADVTIDVIDGGQADAVTTDDDGTADITIATDGDDGVLVTFDHDQWNSYREYIAPD